MPEQRTLLLPEPYAAQVRALLQEHIPEAEVWAYGSRERFERNAAELEAALQRVRKAAAGQALSAEQGRGLVAESNAQNQDVMIRLIENMLAWP